jgi:hypothetical protein
MLVPHNWTDPRTWPWFVYVWIVLFLLGWWKPVWHWLQRITAADWPIARGTIESAEVTGPGTALLSTRSRSSPYTAELAYSYSVSGCFESGRYRRDFPTEDEAWEFTRDLQGKPLAVHYNPLKPSSSRLSEPVLDNLLQTRAPVPATESVRVGGSVPEWIRPFLWVFIYVSAIGLILSMWVHIGAVMGRRVAPDSFFWTLHIGIFIVWFPAALTAIGIAGNTSRKDSGRWSCGTPRSGCVTWCMVSWDTPRSISCCS